MAKKDIEKYQFKKGQTGNPNGRPPKKVSIISHVKDYADQIPDGKEMPRAQLLALALWEKALDQDDEFAQKILLEHLDGRPVSTLELRGDPDNPIHTRSIDLSKLTKKEVLQLAKSLDKAAVDQDNAS